MHILDIIIIYNVSKKQFYKAFLQRFYPQQYFLTEVER